MSEEEEKDYQRLLYDPNQHTPTNPFCWKPACPCHNNQQELARIDNAVQAGFMGESDVQHTLNGRILR